MDAIELKALVERLGRTYGKHLPKHGEAWAFIEASTRHLPPGASVPERVYAAINPSDGGRVCPRGRVRKLKSLVDGYRQGCGPRASCECLRELQSAKMKSRGLDQSVMRAGLLKKHGVDSPMKARSAREKKAATCMERYGGRAPASSEAVRDKMAATCMERYGGRSPASSEAVRDKMAATCMERYGEPHSMSVARAAYREQAGLDNPFQNELVKEKVWNKTWGSGEHAAKIRAGVARSELSRRAAAATARAAGAARVGPAAAAKLEDSDWLRECGLNSYGLALELGVSQTTAWRALTRAGACRPRSGSKPELDIADYMRSLGAEVTVNKFPLRDGAGPMQLDVYSESARLAVEHCGLYWHSEVNQPDSRYHLRKLEACEATGVRLITVFEDEWLLRRAACEARIRHALGASERGPSGRDVDVSVEEFSRASSFIEQQHLQGRGPGGLTVTARANGALVAAMTFGGRRKIHSRSRVDGEWELYRFCTDGRNMPGVASKLFSAFVRHARPSLVVSFSDRRWGGTRGYEAMGFKHVRNTPPGYWYVGSDPTYRRHRSVFQRHRLPGSSGVGTERELAAKLGLSRIYDCGHAVLEWAR